MSDVRIEVVARSTVPGVRCDHCGEERELDAVRQVPYGWAAIRHQNEGPTHYCPDCFEHALGPT